MTFLQSTVQIIWMSQTSSKNTSARRLGPEAKKSIALDALSGMVVTQAARKDAVCRNSVYVQKNKAEAAMDAASLDKKDCNAPGIAEARLMAA